MIFLNTHDRKTLFYDTRKITDAFLTIDIRFNNNRENAENFEIHSDLERI